MNSKLQNEPLVRQTADYLGSCKEGIPLYVSNDLNSDENFQCCMRLCYHPNIYNVL